MPLNANIPRSGMLAAQRRQSVSAHNTANLNTDGVSSQRLLSQEGPGGGVHTQVDTVQLSNEALDLSQSLEGVQNNVDPTSEAVNQITARNQLTQNARTLHTQDRMLGAALDILA
jgi:flagellar basal-body rod protein FlgC